MSALKLTINIEICTEKRRFRKSEQSGMPLVEEGGKQDEVDINS